MNFVNLIVVEVLVQLGLLNELMNSLKVEAVMVDYLNLMDCSILGW